MLHPTCCTGNFDKNLVLETRKFNLIHLSRQYNSYQFWQWTDNVKEGWPVTGEDVTISQFKTIDFYE